MIIASGIVVGCIVISTILCIMCAAGNVNELVRDTDKLEEGE